MHGTFIAEVVDELVLVDIEAVLPPEHLHDVWTEMFGDGEFPQALVLLVLPYVIAIPVSVRETREPVRQARDLVLRQLRRDEDCLSINDDDT